MSLTPCKVLDTWLILSPTCGREGLPSSVVCTRVEMCMGWGRVLTEKKGFFCLGGPMERVIEETTMSTLGNSFRRKSGCWRAKAFSWMHSYCCSVAKSCPTLQPARLPVHRISQAGILEWVAISSSRGSFQPRDWTWVSRVSYLAGRFLTSVPPGKPWCSG